MNADKDRIKLMHKLFQLLAKGEVTPEEAQIYMRGLFPEIHPEEIEIVGFEQQKTNTLGI